MPKSFAVKTQLEISATSLQAAENVYLWQQELIPPHVGIEYRRRWDECREVQDRLEKQFKGSSMLRSFLSRKNSEVMTHLKQCTSLQDFMFARQMVRSGTMQTDPYCPPRERLFHVSGNSARFGAQTQESHSVASPTDRLFIYHADQAQITFQTGANATSQTVRRAEPITAA